MTDKQRLSAIQRIFSLYLTQCHRGTSGVTLSSYHQFMVGEDHGSPVIKGNGSESLIIKKLSDNPPFGNRMPSGRPPLDESFIQLIKTWIDEGATDN